MREVRSSAGRSTQLMWDRLSELLGEQLLISVIQGLPSDPSGLGRLTEDELEMVTQAQKFASDPEEARRVVEEYRRRYG